MYSQNREEHFITEYFKNYPPGRFIDIGAYDVFKFSNTRRLYELGWSGILVEPSPDNFKGLYDHYRHDQKIQVLNCAVGTGSGKLEFYSCQDAVSTSNIEHRDKWAAAGVKYETINVIQRDTLDFMESFARDADFITVDTEATNMELYRAIPDFVFDQIKMFCIEHDNCMGEIEQRLRRFGFKKLYDNAENIILAK